MKRTRNSLDRTLPVLYLLISIIGLALILWIIFQAALLAADWMPGYGLVGLAIILSLVLGGSFWLIRKLAPRFIDRTFSMHDPNRILQEFTLGISNISNPEMLASVSINLIGEALDIQSGYLYDVGYEADPSGGSYRIIGIGGRGMEKPEEIILHGSNPLMEYFQKSRKILSSADINHIPALQNTAALERDWLVRQEMAVFVPIHTRDEWIGLLALGPKKHGQSFTENDLSLIHTLADQMSLALQNARLLASLLRVNNDFRRAYSAMEQSNRQLQQVVNQMERIDKTKSDFISIASHELRTPLTVMRGYTEMLVDDVSLKDNVYQQKMLKGIHSSILRMHEIVESMLDMANIDTRTLSLHKDPVSVHYLIRSITDELQSSLSERQLTLTVDNLRDLPMIEADHEAMGKVFRNLVNNAIKYTPDGGKITISGVTVAPGLMNFPDGGVEVIVSDTGIGIPAGSLELVFTKFYQTSDLSLHSTGKFKYKGAGPGLGLAIAKGIVEAHGGKIWAESPGYDENKCPGSQFHIALPLSHPQ